MTTSQRATSLLPLRYWYATLIRHNTTDPAVTARMTGALKSLRSAMVQETEQDGLPVLQINDPAQEGRRLINGLENPTQGVAVIVELWSLNPFHPHVIRYREADAEAAMSTLVHQAGIPIDVSVLVRFWKEAARAYELVDNAQVFKRVAGGVIVAALVASAVMTAGATAPVIAATLAALGGGAVSVGGLGMVGGMTVLWLGGLAGGGLLAHTSNVLQHIGSEGLRAELTKLEVTQRLYWREGTPGVPSRSTVIRQQKQLLEQVIKLLDDEKAISDAGSPPIKELTEMVRLVRISVERFEALN